MDVLSWWTLPEFENDNKQIVRNEDEVEWHPNIDLLFGLLATEKIPLLKICDDTKNDLSDEDD